MQLRPMKMEDADFMLSLKNDPDTRKFAIQTHDEISKESHYKWLADNIQYFQIIEGESNLKGQRLGAIRIQKKEISIWIDREFRSNGISSWVLEKVSKVGMQAKIVEGNIPSMRAFINAGFKPYSHQGWYYIFKK